MPMPHVDAFAQEVPLGWSVVALRKLPHFALPGYVHRHKKALFQKANEPTRPH